MRTCRYKAELIYSATSSSALPSTVRLLLLIFLMIDLARPHLDPETFSFTIMYIYVRTVDIARLALVRSDKSMG